MTERRRFPVGMTAAVAIVLPILIGLGTWQVQRLHWKEGVLARVAALQAAAAQPIGPVLAAQGKGRDVDFTRVTAVCTGLARAPFLELYSIRDGEAGVRLISACAIASPPYRSVLVDRGFVADTVSARPPVDAENRTPLAITGVLRRPDRRNPFSPANGPSKWFTRDVPAMAAALHAAGPAPVFLFTETPTNPEWKALAPAPVPADIPNNHLGYAITWYGLAAALLGVYAAVLFRGRNS